MYAAECGRLRSSLTIAKLAAHPYVVGRSEILRGYWRRATRLIVLLINWRYEAALRAYAPGGCGAAAVESHFSGHVALLERTGKRSRDEVEAGDE